MKKTLLLVMAMVILGTPVMAQKGQPVGDQKARIFKRKLAFLKENLILNKTESQAFETAYKDYVKQKTSLRKQYREAVGRKLRTGQLSQLSEQEKKEIINQKLTLDKQRYELDRQFTLKLTKILPPGKVIRYFKLERDFNRKMMERLKERKRRRPGKRKPFIKKQ